MLPEALNLELEGLSVLQRKLLLELMHRKHSNHWSKFVSHEYSWQSLKEALEEFLQNHQTELVEEFAKVGLYGNGWKTTRKGGIHV